MPLIKVKKFGDQIYIIYSHLDSQFKIFTGVKVEDEFWSVCALKRNCPDYETNMKQINAMQKRVLDAAMEIRSKGIDPTVERVHSALHAQVIGGPIDQPFWTLYKDYLDGRYNNPATKRKAELFKTTLENFCTWSGYRFQIDSWDRIMFGRFIQYLLIHQKMADSTIHRIVKGIKTFLKAAYPNKDLSWMKYNLLSPEEDPISLKESELKYLIDSDLGGYLEKTRDLFIFLATTGMRFSDSQLSQPYSVTDKDVLKFQQFNTGGHAYPPLFEVSRRVLMKYDGIPPQISNQKFNVYLKELFEELKLNRPVTTHIVKNKDVFHSVTPLSDIVSSQIARNTFISNCLEKDFPVQYVLLMTGLNDYKCLKPFIRSKSVDSNPIPEEPTE
jgi:Phage integrase SAM-like domain